MNDEFLTQHVKQHWDELRSSAVARSGNGRSVRVVVGRALVRAGERLAP